MLFTEVEWDAKINQQLAILGLFASNEYVISSYGVARLNLLHEFS